MKEFQIRRPLISFALATVAAMTLTLTASSARADAIAPDEEGCVGKSAGAECTIKPSGSGHCTASKCNRLDYSDGSPPSTKVVDCLLCVAGGSDASAPQGDGGGSNTGSGSGSGSGSGAGDSGASAPTASNDDGGCSLAAAPLARSVGPWILAIVPLLALRRRSKNRA